MLSITNTKKDAWYNILFPMLPENLYEIIRIHDKGGASPFVIKRATVCEMNKGRHFVHIFASLFALLIFNMFLAVCSFVPNIYTPVLYTIALYDIIFVVVGVHTMYMLLFKVPNINSLSVDLDNISYVK